MHIVKQIKLITLILFSCFIQYAQAQKTVEFYVAPNGLDTADGTQKRPFATLKKAYKAITNINTKDLKKAIIWVNDGTYQIKKPLLIGTEKTTNLSIAFRAIKDTKPVISGAVQLSHWEETEKGLWVSTLPSSITPFRELYINGKRAIRAKHPNTGYLRVKQAGTDKRTNFTYNQGDFPIPKKTINVELTLLHDWSITRIPLKKIDEKNNQLFAIDSIGPKCLNFFNIDNWEPHPRYFLENDIAFLDANNEWFLDTTKKQVYLKLPKGESPASMVIEVPQAESLLQINGTEQQLVSHIVFDGLTFKYSQWKPDSGIYAGIQATYYDAQTGKNTWDVVQSAVHTKWVNNIQFKNCAFTAMGGNGIWFGTGSRNCVIQNCEVTDISGNGIMIGEGKHRLIDGKPWWKTAPQHAAIANKIEDSSISECGKQFYGAVGIWCGLTAETVLKNNEVYNLPYTGISIGWMWSPEVTPCRNNIVKGNHIHHVLQTLSDGGGIYMLGLQPKSKLKNNHIHDISINSGRAESNGMFLDQGTKDVLIKNNLIYNIAKSPIRFHLASTNLVKRNYLFSNGKISGITYNSTPKENITQKRNQVISTDSIYYHNILKKIKLKFSK